MIKIQPCLRNAAEVRHAWGWLLFFQSCCLTLAVLHNSCSHWEINIYWLNSNGTGWVPSKHAAGPALVNAHTSNCEKCYSSLFWGRSTFHYRWWIPVYFYSALYAFQGQLARKEAATETQKATLYTLSHTAHLFWSEGSAWWTKLATHPKGKQFMRKQLQLTLQILNFQLKLLLAVICMS